MTSVLPGLRILFRNRGRLFLVVILLAVSLMFAAAMTSLSANAQQELATVRQLVGTTVTIKSVSDEAQSVQQGGPGANGPGLIENKPPPLPDSLVTQVKQVPGIVSTQASLVRRASDEPIQGGTISGPAGQTRQAPLSVNGIASDSDTLTLMGGNTPTLVAGRGFQASDGHADVALVSQTVAQANQFQVGSTFTLKGITFTVIGLYTTQNQLADSSIIIPLATMQKVFQISGVDSITVTAASFEQVEPLAARLRQALGEQFDVTTQTAKYSEVFSALQTMQQSIEIARITSFVVAAVVVIFAVLQLVHERTSEIAILKALGSSHLQVLRQFWIEILSLSIIAASLALLLLVTLGSFIAQRFDVDLASLVKNNSGRASGGFFLSIGGVSASTDTNPLNNVHLAAATLNLQTLLIILGVSIGLALLTSLIPIWSVSTLKPAEVLRRAD